MRSHKPCGCRVSIANHWRPLATTPPVSPVDARLIRALAATSVAVDHPSLRYALSCVQLDAVHGTVTGTDGRSLVRYDGFKFPWHDHAILLPASDVFGSPILRDTDHGSCGVIDDRLVIEVTPAQSSRRVATPAGTLSGTWTLRLPPQTAKRNPDVAAIISKPGKATNRISFDQQDLGIYHQASQADPRAGSCSLTGDTQSKRPRQADG